MNVHKQNRVWDQQPPIADWSRFNGVSGGAAVLAGSFLLMAVLRLVLPGSQSAHHGLDNFLLIIIKLHAGVPGAQVEALTGLSPIDLLLIGLFLLVALRLYPLLAEVSRAWAVVAASLLPIGLAMYLVTQETGRSGILAASLIFAILMTKSGRFPRYLAATGVAAGALMLIGDSAAGLAYRWPFAIIMSMGYLLLIVWLFGTGWRILHKGSARAENQSPVD